MTRFGILYKNGEMGHREHKKENMYLFSPVGAGFIFLCRAPALICPMADLQTFLACHRTCCIVTCSPAYRLKHNQQNEHPQCGHWQNDYDKDHHGILWIKRIQKQWRKASSNEFPIAGRFASPPHHKVHDNNRLLPVVDLDSSEI